MLVVVNIRQRALFGVLRMHSKDSGLLGILLHVRMSCSEPHVKRSVVITHPDPRPIVSESVLLGSIPSMVAELVTLGGI